MLGKILQIKAGAQAKPSQSRAGTALGWSEDEDSEFDIESEEGAEEPEEDDFGPEGEGTGQNHDMEELGYDEL